jgi:hypothetical protein
MGVEFNEESNFARRDFGQPKMPKLAAWIVSKGIAKDEAGANKVQVILALVFFAIAAFLFFK